MSRRTKGIKMLLHSNPTPHIDPAEDKIVAVKIVAVRYDVPSVWGGKEKYTGYKAEDEQGNIYWCNWDSYPSDSMMPTWVWYCLDSERRGSWYEITSLHPTPRPRWLGKFRFVGYCPIHRRLYYRRNGCFDCYLKAEHGDSKEEQNRVMWKGW